MYFRVADLDFVRCDSGGDWWSLQRGLSFLFSFIPRKKKREKERTASPSAKGTWEVRARSRLSKGANERPRWRIFRECHVAGAGQDGRQDEEEPVRCKRVQKESERNEGKRGRASGPMRA